MGSAMNTEMRQVLERIDKLISKKGFAYALIMAQIEDETIISNNMDKRNVQERLSSNEILFLWSLLVNKEDIYQYPDSLDELYTMRCDIGKLMKDLHLSFLSDLFILHGVANELKPGDYKPQYNGTIFQEAIFYSGGALYDEEYLYYVRTRYIDDSQWLKENKGYDKDTFCNIVIRIKQILATKIRKFRLLSLPETIEERLADKPNDMTVEDYKRNLTLWQFFYSQDDAPSLQEFCDRIKDAISFEIEDLTDCQGVVDYLRIFCIEPDKDCNEACKEPGDYSVLMSKPIIKTPEGHYLLTEIHQLFKSLYDVPRYWLNQQLHDHQKIKTHIGDFSERQTMKVLKGVFGDYCYKDIIIRQGKKQVTDIDALCIWKDYAICVQIKSKGLTLSSHQGNFDAIRSDFEKSFQAAYEQGVKCRDALLNNTEYSFIDKETKQKVLLPSVSEVYIVCESSDEYPSLTHQMAILLHREESDPAALAVNLFDLDMMGKYLNEPYYFVHYIQNRLKYYSQTRTDVETNCLYAYTDNRLLLSGDNYDAFLFDNSFAKAIDAELLPQYEKHEDITIDYSIWRDATFDALLKEIDSSPNNGLGEVVLNLLNFSRNEVKQIGSSINDLLQRGKAATQEYYSFRKGEFGFTFVVMEMGSKDEIHGFIKKVSLKELQTHHAENWLTIVHYQGTSSLVGTLAYIAGKKKVDRVK